MGRGKTTKYLLSYIGGKINVHPRSAGPAVFDSQHINRKHFSLGPYLYCLINKKHKFALEGKEHQNSYTKICAPHKTFNKCVQ